ncbi:hypothetical protein JCM10213_006373 [Rhodosporidiobolus nylandii]
MPIKLYDLVAQPGGRFFSPPCVRARLSLMTKGVEFEMVEVTYHDLRFIWKERLGVEKATAPFIEREDGSLLMDSLEIAKWLDAEYPDRTNLFLPEAPLPVDVKSAEYLAAIEEYEAYDKNKFRRGDAELASIVFGLFAPRFVRMFDAETAEYWTSEARMGEGVWKRLSSQTPESDAKNLAILKEGLADLSSKEFANGRLFLSSAAKPGMKDFLALSSYRLLRAASANLAAQTFESSEVGEWPKWLQRMNELYPLPLYWERDPKE